jgi:hypothetical protein
MRARARARLCGGYLRTLLRRRRAGPQPTARLSRSVRRHVPKPWIVRLLCCSSAAAQCEALPAAMPDPSIHSPPQDPSDVF